MPGSSRDYAHDRVEGYKARLTPVAEEAKTVRGRARCHEPFVAFSAEPIFRKVVSATPFDGAIGVASLVTRPQVPV